MNEASRPLHLQCERVYEQNYYGLLGQFVRLSSSAKEVAARARLQLDADKVAEEKPPVDLDYRWARAGRWENLLLCSEYHLYLEESKASLQLWSSTF